MSLTEITIPKNIRLVLNKIEEQGHKAYIVGGCVRDVLMGRKPHDWDITTDALPEQIQNIFGRFPQVLDGLKHGTVTVIVEHHPIEITTFRVDGHYSDGRRPDGVAFTTDLEADLARRDFTINACAFGRDGLIDPFGGQEDIAAGLIRSVRNPFDRFTEDSLRILRGLRFASELNFSIEHQTSNAMHKLAPLLANVSQERITAELSKTLLGRNVQRVLIEHQDIMLYLIPELERLVLISGCSPHNYSFLEHSIRAIAIAEQSLPLRLALLLRGIDNTNGTSLDNAVKTILRRMRYPLKLARQISVVTQYVDKPIEPTPIGVKRILRQTGAASFQLILKAKRSVALATCCASHKTCSDVSADTSISYSDEPFINIAHKNNKQIENEFKDTETLEKILNTLIEQKACFSLKDLAVDGKDLIKIGFPQGRELGEALNQLLDMVIEEQLPNERIALLTKANSFTTTTQHNE